MTINTKYNIGQEVWFMKDQQHISGEVFYITIKTGGNVSI